MTSLKHSSYEYADHYIKKQIAENPNIPEALITNVFEFGCFMPLEEILYVTDVPVSSLASEAIPIITRFHSLAKTLAKHYALKALQTHDPESFLSLMDHSETLDEIHSRLNLLKRVK